MDACEWPLAEKSGSPPGLQAVFRVPLADSVGQPLYSFASLIVDQCGLVG